jgi:hypothetical protein
LSVTREAGAASNVRPLNASRSAKSRYSACMTAQVLQSLLTDADWFSRFGGPASTIRTVDDLFGEFATWWDWLPTTQSQPDPVHGDALVKVAAELGRHEQRKAAELAAARLTYASLRRLPEHVAGLSKGPHDLTTAAKGAAVYAARMAAREVTVERPGFWCEAVRLLHAGYWPCGRDGVGRLAVY